MQEITGDLFAQRDADAICITTNGFVKANGDNVMGRGCAGAAKERWPGIERAIGACLRVGGNRVHCLTRRGDKFMSWPFGEGHTFIVLPGPNVAVPYHIVTFPTKPDFCSFDNLLPRYQRQMAATGGQKAYPGWMAKSNLAIIRHSCFQLHHLRALRDCRRIILPRPGCGAGELSWDEVRPVLEACLDDRFYVITYK